MTNENSKLNIFLDSVGKTGLNADEIQERENIFRSEIYGTENSADVFVKLKEHFADGTIEKVRNSQFSYWRWYTSLTWAGFFNLPKDEVVFAVSQQIPMALLLDYEPVNEILWNVAYNYPYEDDAELVFPKIKQAFLESNAAIGSWKGKEVAVAELVQEIITINKRGESSLVQAEFESKLKQILFPKNNPLLEKYALANPDDAVNRFIDLVVFFTTVEAKDIWNIADNSLRRRKEDLLKSNPTASTPTSATQKPPTISTVTSKPPLAPSPAPTTQPATQSPKPNPPQPIVTKPVPVVAPAVPTPQQIKTQVELRFSRDEDGQFENVEDVFTMLDRLAKQYSNPKIADMLYFDEAEGKFKWNI